MYNSTMIKVTFRHWKTEELIERIGEALSWAENPASDRMVIKTLEGDYEDIIKSTIVAVEEYNVNS